MKKIAIILIIFVLLPIIFSDNIVCENSYEKKIHGNWIVRTNESYDNKTIWLYGNLTIENNGTLLLDNVTLKIYSKSLSERKINIIGNGKLILKNSKIDIFQRETYSLTPFLLSYLVIFLTIITIILSSIIFKQRKKLRNLT